jgi:hypothetical protein
MTRQATADEIIAYIDLVTSGMLERPEMYASSPEGLEGIFHYLEDIRDLAATGTRRLRYADFAHNARESGSFATRTVIPHAKREEFQPLIAFLKSYLVHENRWPLNVVIPEPAMFFPEPPSK